MQSVLASRRVIAAAVLSLLIAAVPGLADAPAASKLQLEKSVLLIRHGARAPTQTPAELAKSASRPWPEWPVAAGELTEHGIAQMKMLGGYYRQRYAADGLLPAQGCPAAGSVANWADNSVRRVPLSAQALLDGLFPGCGLQAAYAPPAGLDPVFHPVNACAIKPAAARAAVLAAAGGDLEREVRKLRPALQRLQAILQVRSGVNCTDNQPSCGLDGLANSIADSPEGLKLEGGLKLAATVGENFLLEYVQGMPEQEIGWGEASTVETLSPLLAPRNRYVRLLYGTPYLASRNGAPLARAMLAALDDDGAVTDAAASTPPRATRVVAFVGRDFHLAALEQILGVEWSLPGQPDNTPLGGTLAFERLRDPLDGKRYVRTVFYYQTLAQMRTGTALDLAHPPEKLVLKIPGCEKGAIDGACSLPSFRAHVLAALAPDCPAPN